MKNSLQNYFQALLIGLFLLSILGFQNVQAATERRLNALTRLNNQIVGAGSEGNYGSRDFVLTSFDQQGVLVVSFGGYGTGTAVTDFGYDEEATAIVTQHFTVPTEVDKIVAVGTALDSVNSSCHLALARYSAEGVLDTDFGTGGKTLLNFPPNECASAFAAYVTPEDNKIYVVGSQYPNGVLTHSVLIARFTADGLIDPTFNGTGINNILINGFDSEARAMTILPGGDLIIGGWVNSGSGQNSFLARFDRADGAITGPASVFDLSAGKNDAILALTPRPGPTPKIVTCGYAQAALNLNNFAMMQIHSDSLALDTDFAADQTGVVITNVSGDNTANECRDVKIAADGKILLGGYIKDNDSRDFAIAKYNAAGIMSPPTDKAFYDFGKQDEINALEIVPSGVVFGAGYSNNLDANQFAVYMFTNAFSATATPVPTQTQTPVKSLTPTLTKTAISTKTVANPFATSTPVKTNTAAVLSTSTPYPTSTAYVVATNPPITYATSLPLIIINSTATQNAWVFQTTATAMTWQTAVRITEAALAQGTATVDPFWAAATQQPNTGFNLTQTALNHRPTNTVTQILPTSTPIPEEEAGGLSFFTIIGIILILLVLVAAGIIFLLPRWQNRNSPPPDDQYQP